MNKEVRAKYCFYILILVILIWTLFVPKPLKNYSPILSLLIFGVLIFMRFNELENLSKSIKKKYPELFKKYVVGHDLIDIDLLLKSSDFEKLKENDLKAKFRLVKVYFNFSIISFFISILLAITIICIL